MNSLERLERLVKWQNNAMNQSLLIHAIVEELRKLLESGKTLDGLKNHFETIYRTRGNVVTQEVRENIWKMVLNDH